ncbi:sodium:solute symporter family protein [Nocardioides marmotae]|uniref:Sodium/solute symporter n=1 Tax=Nocardioides marmotae TaxID=2663857 RepID=A0A6I3JFS8_9ACTN|nr:sodium:solute symporter family protein [Nocardioides marmotae]MCR6033150.1 sodium/solute symporter [Gordonia jinghuaiqii]MBC9732654.1 sodium:solute symporter family protein [Nocardioides marmotae]MTB83771.1 sodium/solute symporter [Nocardioides marmotae]MTB96803.1 sodium/solute symporter [Nocardioides marmotae]QKE02993.1 sodium:solute symporter family protein [Nocardioides marmotae]
MATWAPTVLASDTLIDAGPVDYLIVGLYFAVVLGIGVMARRQVSDSVDFFLSGRSLPAWVTGLAFIAANLGAVEIMGMSASGAEFGLPTVHYFWVGAIPAMLFLGVVMMPFYYGSKVRSVPEFMFRRFGTGAHLVNSISFAIAQLLIAGINLYLLGTIIQALLGWPLFVALIVAAVVVLSYITLGGLSAAIYNEVLQFFVIVAALLPLTLIGLDRVGGWGGLKDQITDAAADNPDTVPAAQQLNSWPGNALTGFDSDLLSVIGIVFGLGFVLSFGYWTTNFVEVQRAMATDSISSARKTPIIGAFPKMFIPFITILPGMIAAVLVSEIAQTKAGEEVSGGTGGTVTYNDSLLYLMRDLLPNGLLGVAIAGLLAAFMAGMAANISAFNTVFSYDLWQRYAVKDRDDDYYLTVGRLATLGATIVAVGTAYLATNFSNIMDYLQTLFGFFNAPLFATFILGMFWKRMTATAGWVGLVSGTLSAVLVAFLSEDAFGSLSLGVIPVGGQGAAFLAAGAAFVVDIVLSVLVSLVTKPKPVEELRGLVYSETPREDLVDADEASYPWYRRTLPLAGVALAMVVVLNLLF